MIGSWTWARKYGGRLTMTERFAFYASGIRSRLRSKHTRRGSGSLDVDALRFPDSAEVKRAFALAEQTYEPWLHNHCVRTYFWGGLVAQREQRTFDVEALLIASLLHDVGLVKHEGAECFAVRGGEFAHLHGYDEGIAESIAMHLNIAVAPSAGTTNYLLHQGAAVDVVGWGLAKVRPCADLVVSRHPRLDFKRKFGRLLAAESRAHPHGRLAIMIRFGFLDLIARSPHAE